MQALGTVEKTLGPDVDADIALEVQELCIEQGEFACKNVRAWLAGWTEALPLELRHDVELLTHELVANAFRHSGTTRAWVTALLLPESVIVQVTDEGRGGQPRLRPLEPYAESGRGLHWVSTLARSWGVYQQNTTAVWFELAYP